MINAQLLVLLVVVRQQIHRATAASPCVSTGEMHLCVDCADSLDTPSERAMPYAFCAACLHCCEASRMPSTVRVCVCVCVCANRIGLWHAFHGVLCFLMLTNGTDAGMFPEEGTRDFNVILL